MISSTTTPIYVYGLYVSFRCLDYRTIHTYVSYDIVFSTLVCVTYIARSCCEWISRPIYKGMYWCYKTTGTIVDIAVYCQKSNFIIKNKSEKTVLVGPTYKIEITVEGVCD